MIKYNTKKKFFKTTLINFPVKSTEINISIKNTTLLQVYENDSHIGYHIKSISNYTSCKVCKAHIKRNKGFNDIVVNYGSFNSKIILVRANLKKYYCIKCKATTIESIIDKNGKMQSTNTVIKSIIKELSTDSTYTSISKRFGESITNIIKRFDTYTKSIPESKEKINIKAIGVDEVSMIKSKNNKYQFIVIDHSNGNIVDIIDGRKKDEVLDLIENRYIKINYVSMDLWKTYRDSFKNIFDDIVVIADRFHVVRIFMWAFSRSRINVFKEKNMGTTKHWRILTCKNQKLDENGKYKLNKILNTIPELKTIYIAKEMAFETLKKQSVDEFKNKFNELIKYVYDNKLTEYYSAINTVNYWYDEICNMFEYGEYSNGRVERINTSLKRMKSLVYGFRNKKITFKLVKHKMNKIS